MAEQKETPTEFMNCHFFLIFRLQKFESDSEEEDATLASPMVQIKEELSANESITPNDIEMFSAEDVGNNVTICHDTDVKDELDGHFEEAPAAFASDTNLV